MSGIKVSNVNMVPKQKPISMATKQTNAYCIIAKLLNGLNPEWFCVFLLLLEVVGKFIWDMLSVASVLWLDKSVKRWSQWWSKRYVSGKNKKKNTNRNTP